MKLNQLTIKQALNGLKQNQFSSIELTTACLKQINKTDKKIHAFLTLNPKALTEARLADKKIKASKNSFKQYPLLGIPYALKDNFLTKDLRTTASAKLLDKYIPQYNSTGQNQHGCLGSWFIN